MIELIIGLIAILVLLATLVQITDISKAYSESMRTARAQAGIKAMSSIETLSDAVYIRDWQEGRDDKRYTRDDMEISGNVGTANTMINYTLIDSAPPDINNMILSELTPIQSFNLLKASDTHMVPLLPAIRNFIYRKEFINIESEVWMTWTKGIY